MLFICYPRCSTCKKAMKFLDENGVKYEFRDIKEKRPTVNELKKWHKQSGLPLRRFFNTSGQLYRELELSKKLGSMSEAEQFDLHAGQAPSPHQRQKSFGRLQRGRVGSISGEIKRRFEAFKV